MADIPATYIDSTDCQTGAENNPSGKDHYKVEAKRKR